MLHVEIEDEIPDMPKSPEPSPPNQMEAMVPEGESSSQSRLSQFTSSPSELFPEELAPQIVGIFHDNLYAIVAAVRILNSNERSLLRRNSDSSTLSYRRGSVNYSINQPLIRRANSAPTSLYSSCSGVYFSLSTILLMLIISNLSNLAFCTDLFQVTKEHITKRGVDISFDQVKSHPNGTEMIKQFVKVYSDAGLTPSEEYFKEHEYLRE